MHVRPARGGATSAVYTGIDGARRVHHARAARRASARRRARRSSKDEQRARRVPRALHDPEVRAGEVRAGPGGARRHRPRRRLDVVARPCSSTTTTASILSKAYQLSKGNPIQDTKELLAQLQGVRHRSGRRRSRCIGFGATGYAADVLEESRASRDVNIVETVAHMMSAVHFFGDVDVICDIGGQDIKVLFMKNGDIKNFRLSNQCSAGNGMLLQAMADQFGVPVTDYADVAFEAELAPKFSYGCAVFLDTDRVNFQKEGFSKEELLAGPRAGAAEERLAVRRADPAPGGARAASSCCRAARSTTSPPSRRRSTTSRSACPAPRSSCTRTRGEAGAIGAAMETLRVVKRTRQLDLHRHRCGDRPRVHDEERRGDALPLLPERVQAHVHRHQDARRRDVSRYISGFSCEKGTVESEGGDARARRRAQEDC